MNWKIKDRVGRQALLQGYIDDYMTEMRDDDVVSLHGSIAPIAFLTDSDVIDTQTKCMFKATEHLLPPPLPQPEPILEETTTTDPETGEITTIQTLVPQPAPPPPEPNYDVVEEAAKMPLEVAVACSLLSASPDRVSNLAGSILILGGGGAVEGFGDALRWRLVHGY